MPPLPSFSRRFLPVFLVGLAGLLPLPWRVAEQLAAAPLPEPLASLPRAAVLALSLLNPIILLGIAAAVGAACAHRAGLGSAIAGTRAWPSARQWGAAVVAGLLLAATLAAADGLLARQAQAAWTLAAGPHAARPAQLALGLLYGGLTEEVLMRWGLMSLLAWAGLHLPTRERLAAPILVASALLSAVVFAAGHLPALAAAGPVGDALVVRTLLLNTVAGLAYALLFWRLGLESAMAAHAATHLGFFLVALPLR